MSWGCRYSQKSNKLFVINPHSDFTFFSFRFLVNSVKRRQAQHEKNKFLLACRKMSTEISSTLCITWTNKLHIIMYYIVYVYIISEKTAQLFAEKLLDILDIRSTLSIISNAIIAIILCGNHHFMILL